MDPAPLVGVLMLDTRFPRLPGDIGNPATFAGRVRYARLPGAVVARAVRADGVPPDLVAAFADAARALEAEGARVIATSCGFLGAAQAALAGAVGVPVVTSALVMLPAIRALTGGRGPVGILTFDSRRLAPVHFAGAFDPADPVAGLEGGQALFPTIAGDRPTLDPAAAQADALAAARRLAAHRPRPAALVLECTNLSPYRRAIAAATGLPVFDVVQAIGWALAAAEGADGGSGGPDSPGGPSDAAQHSPEGALAR